MTAMLEPTTFPAPAAGSCRLLAAPGPDLAAHARTHGPLPAIPPEALLAELDQSGLTGRGGAGFPTARKLRAVAAYAGRKPGVRGGGPVVVANGAEGEPASAKDRHLLSAAPHLVLDGVELAARAVGAVDAVVYVPAGPARDAVLRAIAERPTGDRHGSGRVAVRVVQATGGFVAGQETAVVSALEGGPPLPRHAPRRVVERGVAGHPTLVQNVETLAQVALVARYGGAWFRAAGTADAAGTFLATVHGGAGGARVWEVPHGTGLGELLGAARVPAPAAVLVGGYHGAWLPMPASAGVPLTPAALAAAGGRLGAGVLMPLAAGDCGLATTARIVRYLAGESARQCGPCMFGLPHLAALLDRLVAGERDPRVVDGIHAGIGLVQGRGACHHPDGTAVLVASALRVFERDIDAHRVGACTGRAA